MLFWLELNVNIPSPFNNHLEICSVIPQAMLDKFAEGEKIERIQFSSCSGCIKSLTKYTTLRVECR